MHRRFVYEEFEWRILSFFSITSLTRGKSLIWGAAGWGALAQSARDVTGPKRSRGVRRDSLVRRAIFSVTPS